MLALVLSTGSLEKQVLELFSSADLPVILGVDRAYHATVADPRIHTVRFLRPPWIPPYVARLPSPLPTRGPCPLRRTALGGGGAGGWVTVGLAGRSGGKMPELCDHCLRVPSDATPRIQEGHISIGHTVCWLIERQLFPRAETPGAAA